MYLVREISAQLNVTGAVILDKSAVCPDIVIVWPLTVIVSGNGPLIVIFCDAPVPDPEDTGADPDNVIVWVDGPLVSLPKKVSVPLIL